MNPSTDEQPFLARGTRQQRTADIAANLGISPNTPKSRIRHIHHPWESNRQESARELATSNPGHLATKPNAFACCLLPPGNAGTVRED